MTETPNNVLTLATKTPFPVLASMYEQIMKAIEIHGEGVPTAQAIGVLEMVKLQLIKDQQ